MSSDSSDVNNGFHFYWDIENIDMCFSKERITSPKFVANNLNQTEWCISLHPSIKENTFMLVLTRMDRGNSVESISIDLAVSVSTSDGIQKVLKEEKKAEFQTGSSITCYWIYRSSEILYEEDLTVYCYMQQSEKETLPHIRCWARTVLGKEQRCSVWKVKSFRHLPPGCQKKFTLCSTVKLSPHIEISGLLSKKSRFFHIELIMNHCNPFFIFGKISLLTANGDLKWPTIESFSYDSSKGSQTYKFPLILKQGILAPEFLNSRPSYLLPEGSLTLLCEFNISTDMQYSEIIESNYLIPNYRELTHREISRNKSEELPLDTEEEDTDDTHQISANSDANNRTPQTLKEDLKNFYKQKKHCDITLHAEKKSFPAHRSILCSRSSVFSSMFDHDMKETINQKVEILDIDADTLDRFLLFLYSETLEDLQWNRVTKLLYAANKYQVESLKEECSSFLMSHLSLSNVCEALVLADLYQDDQLRAKCQDFILENAAEIFSSKEWEIFTVGNPLLSAKMLQKYFSMKK
ncbi:Protein roadkill [Araneus ventricosus]|uniref:Protein roadkill n=1 Tax=Araneus ventricosus TaxID=182803 RepID=A0A4Y2P0Z3_ARAVE|nr:Protein roadkill [Araneus ventricosus]